MCYFFFTKKVKKITTDSNLWVIMVLMFSYLYFLSLARPTMRMSPKRWFHLYWYCIGVNYRNGPNAFWFLPCLVQSCNLFSVLVLFWRFCIDIGSYFKVPGIKNDMKPWNEHQRWKRFQFWTKHGKMRKHRDHFCNLLLILLLFLNFRCTFIDSFFLIFVFSKYKATFTIIIGDNFQITMP